MLLTIRSYPRKTRPFVWFRFTRVCKNGFLRADPYTMTTDPCPQCKSSKTVLVAPPAPELVAQRCTECGTRWSVPVSLRATLRLDIMKKHGAP